MVFVNAFTYSLQSSLNGSTSSLPDSTGRSYSSSFSVQSGAGSPVFHHSGELCVGMVKTCFLPKYLCQLALSLQEVCRDCIIFMVTSMFQTCRVHLDREVQL